MAEILEIRVPDIGDFDEVSVVEVLVQKGDRVEVDQGLVTLESDKASMEVPSTHAGVIEEVKVAVGDKVGQDAVIVTLKADEAVEVEENVEEKKETKAAPPPAAKKEPPAAEKEPPAAAAEPSDHEAFKSAHAGPAVRRFARELGVDLSRVHGTGRKGRILKQDVEAWVKSMLRGVTPAAAGAFALPEMPDVDFSKFGPVETKPLSRIRQVAAKNLHRSWLHVPHVTQHEEADVTELEAFRKAHGDEAKNRGFKLTPVAFLLKASASALRAFPDFRSSLSKDGQSLVVKDYVHVGVAVDTQDGLVVPVIRDVDKKGLLELAQELGEVSGRAREGKLLPKDFQGGCFTVSSLGGIGGTAFTPIVNAPEVAILGVSRSSMKPVWDGEQFVPRLMLPLSLSYDHRVIDGAQAARFIVHLSGLLADLRRLLL